MAIKNLILKLGLKGVDKTKSGLSDVDKGLGNLANRALKVAGAFYASKGLINGITQTIEVSSQLKSVELGFKNLSSGIGGAEETLDKLRNATDGTVNSIDLMTQANNAMLLGIFDNNDQMAEMFDVAQRLGSALGQDTLFGVESLVTGMGRQSKLMLDNLGIMVDTNKANELFAESLGKTTKELTEQERKQAFNNEAMRQAKILVDGLGEEQLTTSDRIKILQASFIDLQGTIGTALTPVFNNVLDVLGDFSLRVSGVVQALGRIDFAETGRNMMTNLTALVNAITETLKLQFDAIPELFAFSFRNILNVAKFILENLVKLVSNVATFLFEPIFVFAQNVSARVQNLFIGMFNFLKEQFNSFSETFIGQKLGIEKLQMTDFIDVESISQDLANTSIGQFFGGENEVQNLSDFTEKTKAVWGDYFDTVKVLAKESGDVVTKSINNTGVATEVTADKVQESSLKQAIAIGQSSESILGSIRQVIKAKFSSIIADVIASEVATKGFLGLITGAGLAAGASKLFDSVVPKFAEGGIVQGSGNRDTVPALLTPGEVILNRAQQENITGNMGGINVTINAPLVDETVVESIIPAIEKAQRQNLA